jgi:hypothetical protein
MVPRPLRAFSGEPRGRCPARTEALVFACDFASAVAVRNAVRALLGAIYAGVLMNWRFAKNLCALIAAFDAAVFPNGRLTLRKASVS